MASVHKKPKTRFWHAAWRDGNGRLYQRSTKQINRSDALRVALEYERAEKLATAGSLTEAQVRAVLSDIVKRNGNGEQLRNPSCRDWLTHWIQAKSSTCEETTVLRYEKTVSCFLESLGKKSESPLCSLTATDVQKFVTMRLKSGCAPSTVQVDGKALRGALNRAKREGLILSNPAEAVELPKRNSVTKAVFSAGEVEAIMQHAKGEWRAVTMVGFYTGARLSECCRVAWEDIDMSMGLLSFPKTKQGRVHSVPLHPNLKSFLESLKIPDGGGYLSPKLEGVKTTGQRGLSESFKRIMRAAGVDDGMVEGSGKRRVSKRSFHSLRHTFNSILANAGVPQEVRMKLVGHTTASVNSGYTHHEIEMLGEAMKKLPSVLPRE
jgi:integrase